MARGSDADSGSSQQKQGAPLLGRCFCFRFLRSGSDQLDGAALGIDRDIHPLSGRAGAGIGRDSLGNLVSTRHVSVAHDDGVGPMLAEQSAGSSGIGTVDTAKAGVLDRDVAVLEELGHGSETAMAHASGQPRAEPGEGIGPAQDRVDLVTVDEIYSESIALQAQRLAGTEGLPGHLIVVAMDVEIGLLGDAMAQLGEPSTRSVELLQRGSPAYTQAVLGLEDVANQHDVVVLGFELVEKAQETGLVVAELIGATVGADMKV